MSKDPCAPGPVDTVGSTYISTRLPPYGGARVPWLLASGYNCLLRQLKNASISTLGDVFSRTSAHLSANSLSSLIIVAKLSMQMLQSILD